jgi:hypothetical protein
MKYLFVTLIVILAGFELAHAEDCSSPLYKGLDNRKKQIRETIEFINRHAKLIEAVPPSESEYLTKEKDDALENLNMRRLDLLLNREYYYPNELNKSIVNLNSAMKGIFVSGKLSDQALMMTDALDKATLASVAFDSYFSFDKKRKPSVLDERGFNLITASIIFSQSALKESLRCTIREMKEP